MFKLCVIVSFIAASQGFVLDTFFGQAPLTVPALDLDKYTGRWYQMYASQSVVTLWENGAVCVTADYEKGDDGSVSVLNSERIENGSMGNLQVIHGYATPSNDPGKLSVHLETVPIGANYEYGANNTVTVLNSERINNGSLGTLEVIHGFAIPDDAPGHFKVHLETVPINAPYWVLQLGPATYGPKGQYQYSVVSDNVRGTLFVLARDPDVFYNDYDTDVMTFLKTHGFTTFYNRPISTYHGKDCVYNTDHH